ncbi:efflux RND transporter permease subunit [Bryobacter aggregatus]|uniref:efflux RND transporter permease subunit n=1 Tax=Bryobacter aggregatus TaxID=360054 RepID=UPI0004E13852|nr:efflux RND transporter permease subunit [Bryobacter aggregatus]
MSRFAIRTPYFIVVICLAICVLGASAVVRMPVDLFPAMNIPVVVVATFYTGMSPDQIETSITARYERFFTLAPNIDHIESRSLTGVSLIKIYFQAGSNADAAVGAISNLAMANIRRLPVGTLPPIVLKFDASSLPVCLVTFEGEGLDDTRLRDLANNVVRAQIASVPGASIPQPFGGPFRQIMVYADPNRLEGYQMSLMDLVRGINSSNLILPAGSVKIGPRDYNVLSNSLLETTTEIDAVPVKAVNGSIVRVSDVATTEDSHTIQTNVVRINGQKSVYLPILKQGGDTNTIAVVDGIKQGIKHIVDVPHQLKNKVVFDQSEFVKTAIETLIHEGAIGLFLTSAMILIFLGSFRATVAVCFSIPISVLAAFLLLKGFGASINSMVLGGFALAFSRLIDNSVVVLENIYRHLEMGTDPVQAAEIGGKEVALPVLSATLTTAVVFFPVTFLYGVSQFLFSALALAVVLSLAASYFVAMTVVPLFCARFIKSAGHDEGAKGFFARFNRSFNRNFDRLLQSYDRAASRAADSPRMALAIAGVLFVLSLGLYPLLGVSFFPRTDAGQFVMNIKAPTGTRIELTNMLFDRVDKIVRQVVPPEELELIVANIGVNGDISSIYSPNAAPHTGFIQVALKQEHRVGSYEYMARMKKRLDAEMPELSVFFQSGGLVDAVLNMGMAAPINVQVSGSNLRRDYEVALALADRIRRLPNVADVFLPQDLDYPALRMEVDRTRASELGLSQQEVVQNVITALSSNQMIAPSFWVDPRTGQDYLLTVQYPEKQIANLQDMKAITLRGPHSINPARLDAVSKITNVQTPTEVGHYQLRRAIDVYVRPETEALGELANRIDAVVAEMKVPDGVSVDLRGMVLGMRQSFRSFALGLILATVLLYLILVAQFASFLDPLLILLAVPPGISGVLLTLWATNTTLNVMSLMGIVMLVGIAVSNSILIVEFTRHLIHEGLPVRQAVLTAAKVRLRPVLMTSLATIIGLLPMALKIGQGSEAYAPLARALLGGLAVSVVFTIFVVPVAYLLAHPAPESAS